MYEHITFEVILERMLDKVSNTLDKREGSIIYNALAPAAVELQIMYIEFDSILNESFADTQSRDFLVRRAAERGITPFEATNATLKGEFNIAIPIGSRFSMDELNYIAVENIAGFDYMMRCETKGTEGNKHFGSLIPIDYIDGLTSAELTEVLIPGEDDEEVESLRSRYFQSFDTKPYGGNKQDYIQKTNAISGVGSTKVTPIWDGGGTVKLTILDSSFNKASNSLIDIVQTEVDPVLNSGKGVGIAPIGHVVTVDTVDEVTINISTTITLDEGYSWGILSDEANQIIGDYLLELRKDWATQSQLVVRIAQIETRLLGIDGIIDIEGTSINSAAQNLTLNQYQIPMMGGISV